MPVQLAVIATITQHLFLAAGHTPSNTALKPSTDDYFIEPTSTNDGWLKHHPRHAYANLFAFRRITETDLPEVDGEISAAGRKFWLTREIADLIRAGRVWVNVQHPKVMPGFVITEATTEPMPTAETQVVDEQKVDALLAAADAKNYDLLAVLLGMNYAAFVRDMRESHDRAAIAHNRIAESRVIEARMKAGRVERQAHESAQGRYWGRNAQRVPKLNRAETELVAQAWAEAAAVKLAQQLYPAFDEAVVRQGFIGVVLDYAQAIRRAANHRRRTGCPPHDGRTVHPEGTRPFRHARRLAQAAGLLAEWGHCSGYDTLAVRADLTCYPCFAADAPADALDTYAPLDSATAQGWLCRSLHRGHTYTV